MAKTIAQIADKVACGGAQGANTGKLGCLSLFGSLEHLIALRKGTKIQGSEEFNVDLIKQLVMDGKAVPLIGASMFEDVSAEDGYSTNQKGVKRLNLKGLPEYRLTFEEGHEFYRQLDKLTSFKSWDFILGDEEGNWMVAENSDGTVGGFTAGHTTAELTSRKVAGGDPESKALLVQFLDRLQFDRNYAILHQEYLDFSPNDVPAVNGVFLEFNSVPTAGTSLEVKATLAQDRNTPVEGLTDFSVIINGVESTATAAESPAGIYTLTVSSISASDEIEVLLGTSAANIVESNGVLFRSLPLKDTV